jgi:hypothetical protein
LFTQWRLVSRIGPSLAWLAGWLAAANCADLRGPPIVPMRVKMQLRGALAAAPLITIS